MTISHDPKSTKVALLAGGTSDERDISIASGEGAQEALIEAGYQVDLIDPARREDLVKVIEGNYDVAFLALHGKHGEDGTIQGFLEIIGIPYTGPGVLASATAIDKAKTKVLYELSSVPTPISYVITSSEDMTVEEIKSQVGVPCVIKAASEGSALGVYICDDDAAIEQALHDVFLLDSKALVERFIDGEEYTVAVLGTEEPRALPVIKIIPINDFYDFESKYAEGGSSHICPAPLTEELTKRAQELAINAHKALECAGMSRSDLLLDQDGNFWVLETNTIPGMTKTSLLPDAARAEGIEFSDLCVFLVEEALNRRD